MDLDDGKPNHSAHCPVGYTWQERSGNRDDPICLGERRGGSEMSTLGVSRRTGVCDRYTLTLGTRTWGGGGEKKSSSKWHTHTHTINQSINQSYLLLDVSHSGAILHGKKLVFSRKISLCAILRKASFLWDRYLVGGRERGKKRGREREKERERGKRMPRKRVKEGETPLVFLSLCLCFSSFLLPSYSCFMINDVAVP
jgi:hypothetical protein